MVVNYSHPQRSPWVRFVFDYNPFYLLSAMCMLAGLFSLVDSLDWSPLPMFNVLMLIVMLNAYELLLIGFGIFLYNRGLKRDALTLLVLEAFFLVDAGFLNSEVFTQSFEVGVIVNLILFVLAFVKVAVVFRALGLPVRGGVFALVMIQLALLFTMPGVFKLAADGREGTLPALALYGVWWAVGGIVAFYGVLLRGFSQGPRFYRFAQHRLVVGALITLGLISILAHLCTSNWVYDVRWYGANLAPLMLGLCVAATSAKQLEITTLSRLRTLGALPVLAIFLSSSFPSGLEFQPGGLLVFSPLRLILIGAAFVYLYAMCVHRQPLFGVAFTGCLMVAGMGHSVPQIGVNVASVGQIGGDALKSLMPKSAVHWGVTSVVVSFVLLLAGVLISLLKGRLESAELTRYLDDQLLPRDGDGVRVLHD